MKIMHVITRLIVGGAQENTLLSCEGQHQLGHEVTLVTGPAIGPEGSLLERAKTFGYRVEVVDAMRRAISPAKDWATYRRLKQIYRQFQPDVVHTHSSKAGIIGRWAAHAVRHSHPGQCRPVIIHTIHGLAFTASTKAVVNGLYKLLEKRTAPITDKIVCVADSMTQQSLAAGVGRAEQYVTVYSGMETAVFLSPPVPRDVIRRQLGLAETDIAVGTIARLFDLKGHDDLLDLAPGLCEQFPALKFLWVGDGSLRGRLESRIAEMKLQNRFILTGLVPPTRIPELTGAMDILVHPSRREGLARALPQGALCGCPCVTYDIDGAKEAVQDQITGFVIPPFDRKQFGEAIARLMGDAAARRSMGETGRAFAVNRFDAATMVQELEKVYAASSVSASSVSSSPARSLSRGSPTG